MKTKLIDTKVQKHELTVSENEEKMFVLRLDEENGKEQRIDLTVNLIGEGAVAKIFGVIVGKGETKFTINTVQNHVAPHTTSDLLIKGVFADTSSLAYTGQIKIAKEAQYSNAFQKESNLVLNEGVKIDTRPELEIEANEVRCTHAATVAKINEEEVFYLQTRGLERKMGEELIVEGFLGEVREKIEDEEVRNRIKGVKGVKT